MRKLLFIAALLLAASSAMAGHVDLSTAQTTAANFLRSKATHGRLMTSTPTVKWTHEVKNSSNIALTTLYIVNTDKGYAIVAGDDRAKEVLAYGEGCLESINDLPEAVHYFLDIYQKQLEYLQAHPGMMPEKYTKNRGVSVEPMLRTAWAQGKPYNMQCPKVGRDYCKVGCSALSLAQVMRYWEYPAGSPALPGYTGEEFGITVPALPEYTFDWDNMWDTYENYTSDSQIDRIPEANKNAITYYLRYVGQAETMDYGISMSGAEYDEILQALRTFGYDEGAHYEMKDDYDTGYPNYNDEEWAALIQSELAAGRPLVYCAYDMSSDSTSLMGHAFNVDGYDAVNDLYHVNFGMSSSLNAYYALNAFAIDAITVYDFFPLLFAGVQPPGLSTDPRILVDNQNVNMQCYAGETTTDTITVKGQNLTEGITVTLNDENGVFSIDVTSISLDAASNASIVVTYAPQTAGSHNATITLSSEGADDKVITIHGTATNAPLVVYDPVMLPADSAHIALTSFRADWTDQTPAQNVVSYTLQVNQKPTSGLIAEADWSNVPSSGNAANYLPEGWVVGPYSIYCEGGCISITSDSYIRTNELDLTGFDKVTVVFKAKNYYTWTYSALTVQTSVDEKYFQLTNDWQEYTVVLNCASSDQVTFFSNTYYPQLQWVKIYAGEYEPQQLRATEEGNDTYREITGITDKFYTVNNLLAEGTFLYKVKAIYTDGTESAWSNTQMVTLFDNGPAPHEYAAGDVNHDNSVNIADVTTLIDYLLGTGDVCPICADVNMDQAINIADVTALIDKLLSNN